MTMFTLHLFVNEEQPAFYVQGDHTEERERQSLGLLRYTSVELAKHD